MRRPEHYIEIDGQPIAVSYEQRQAWRVRGRHDTASSVHLMGGYATPAALMDALAGLVVWGEP